MRGRDRRGWCEVLGACVLVALTACRTPKTPKTPEPPPPTTTATPLPAPNSTPTVRAMPVRTTPATSLYDRTPGVLQEEKRPPGRTPASLPTPRPQ